ncbi:hypothetical protein DFQ27_000924 [Actinomortierella ambigua]|uniref:TM2 domain-containing protein n=1 Tax=Actinomortierella ambigua TaxID=1343610 RepID=A0A9P6QF59_9FUNG|nr:hypothetical protein DFQ26_005617 [Actinomortierella ambigua]KAG0264906.1 hypothetical protein DFQ27_000924 [Actinomortierella ambigua]
MASYGSTNNSQGDEERPLLNGRPIEVQANTTFYGRTIHHARQHKFRLCAVWGLIALIAVGIVVAVHFAKDPKAGGDLIAGLLKPRDRCESDRSYPVAILLSIFLGYLGVDRFYLGHIITGILKLITAGGFGIWYLIDVVLIILDELPDHNGCHLLKA